MTSRTTAVVGSHGSDRYVGAVFVHGGYFVRRLLLRVCVEVGSGAALGSRSPVEVGTSSVTLGCRDLS